MSDTMVNTNKRHIECQRERSCSCGNSPKTWAKTRSLGECDSGDLIRLFED